MKPARDTKLTVHCQMAALQCVRVSRRTHISVAVGNNTAFQKVGKREEMVTGAMVSQ